MLLELIVVRRSLVPEPTEPRSVTRVADNPSHTEHDQRQTDWTREEGRHAQRVSFDEPAGERG